MTEATRYLKVQGVRPTIGVVLGTGLGDEFVSRISNPIIIPYNSIPYFPVSTVSGLGDVILCPGKSGFHILQLEK